MTIINRILTWIDPREKTINVRFLRVHVSENSAHALSTVPIHQNTLRIVTQHSTQVWVTTKRPWTWQNSNNLTATSNFITTIWIFWGRNGVVFDSNFFPVFWSSRPFRNPNDSQVVQPNNVTLNGTSRTFVERADCDFDSNANAQRTLIRKQALMCSINVNKTPRSDLVRDKASQSPRKRARTRSKARETASYETINVDVIQFKLLTLSDV